MPDTYYKPGLVFLSKAANLQIPVLEPKRHLYPDGSFELLRKEVVAYFGDDSLSSSEFAGADGHPVAEIRGGCFDLDQQAERFDWTEEEREAVARKLTRLADDQTFTYVTLYKRPVPVAPWPTYDTAHHNQIPVLAEQLGLLSQALDYERATKNRDGVIRQLEERLLGPVEEREALESLSAA